MKNKMTDITPQDFYNEIMTPRESKNLVNEIELMMVMDKIRSGKERCTNYVVIKRGLSCGVLLWLREAGFIVTVEEQYENFSARPCFWTHIRW